MGKEKQRNELTDTAIPGLKRFLCFSNSRLHITAYMLLVKSVLRLNPFLPTVGQIGVPHLPRFNPD